MNMAGGEKAPGKVDGDEKYKYPSEAERIKAKVSRKLSFEVVRDSVLLARKEDLAVRAVPVDHTHAIRNCLPRATAFRHL